MNGRRKFLLGAGGACATTASLGVPSAGRGLFAELQRITAAAGDAVLGNAHAQVADDYKALICIFMFGGNDGNNLLIPGDAGQYGLYSRARGPLALAQTAVLPIAPTNTNGTTYALHPAMVGVQNLFKTGKAALVANVGPLAAPTSKAQYDARSVALPPNLFSHSDQQAQWQSSISDGTGRTGWGGRIGDLMQSLNSNRGATCISLAGNNLWETGSTITSYKVSPSGNFGFDFYKPESNDPLSVSIGEVLASQRTHLFEQAWLGTIQKALENQRVLSQAITSQQFNNAFPNTSLGAQLRMAARLIAARNALGLKRQTMFCSIGGFDTHGDDQINRQQQLLGEISAAVSAFYDATVALGVADKVTTFTASDFGRTLQSNGQGSDHGWGNHHIVIGGAVKGGALYGTYPNLALNGPDDVGSNGVWIPTTAVDQYAATMARWFGVSPTEMPTIIPNLLKFAPTDLGFMT
jgi:uncharacterized protein (DUF1501 family)